MNFWRYFATGKNREFCPQKLSTLTEGAVFRLSISYPLLQDRYDLLFREPRSFHRFPFLRLPAAENSHFTRFRSLGQRHRANSCTASRLALYGEPKQIEISVMPGCKVYLGALQTQPMNCLGVFSWVIDALADVSPAFAAVE